MRYDSMHTPIHPACECDCHCNPYGGTICMPMTGDLAWCCTPEGLANQDRRGTHPLERGPAQAKDVDLSTRIALPYFDSLRVKAVGNDRCSLKTATEPDDPQHIPL